MVKEIKDFMEAWEWGKKNTVGYVEGFTIRASSLLDDVDKILVIGNNIYIPEKRIYTIGMALGGWELVSSIVSALVSERVEHEIKKAKLRLGLNPWLQNWADLAFQSPHREVFKHLPFVDMDREVNGRRVDWRWRMKMY